MQAGKLRHRVTFERAVETRDELGAVVSTWVNLATVWASRRRASSRETLVAAEVAAAITDIFECRYSIAWGDLNPLDRLIFDNRTYDIVSVDPTERRDGLRISAMARAE